MQGGDDAWCATLAYVGEMLDVQVAIYIDRAAASPATLEQLETRGARVVVLADEEDLCGAGTT